jgi:hypothetical protein
MPSFLRDLRRKSKSFRGERPATVSANAPNLPNGAPLKSPTPGDLPRNKSSSTLNSTYQNSSSSGSKPPSNRGSQSNLKANGTNAAPPVPVRPPVNTKRYSINVSYSGFRVLPRLLTYFLFRAVAPRPTANEQSLPLRLESSPSATIPGSVHTIHGALPRLPTDSRAGEPEGPPHLRSNW